MRYQWPGNVRELQNVMERAVILSPGKVLRPCLEELQPLSQTIGAVGLDNADDRITLKDVEREHIIRALAATNWVLARRSKGRRGQTRVGANVMRVYYSQKSF